VSTLADFHRERIEVLCESGADMLAIETIPSFEEARALRDLLEERDGVDAWVSFTCRDGARLRDGTPIREAVSTVETCPRVTAVGVNCTDPEHVSGLIREIRTVSAKRIIVYPNSGERWDAVRRCWTGEAAHARFVDLAAGWARLGVWAVGGCCRVGPETIRDLAVRLRA
jgi:homocysteine S-methyltransferase